MSIVFSPSPPEPARGSPHGHVLVVSLGPVQDFIASARTCQDLWFGSWLLSDLSRAAAKRMNGAEHSGVQLVFPYMKPDEGVHGVANKILAVVPANLSPKAVAEAGEQAMRERLVAMSDKLFARMKGLRHIDLDLAHKQLADLMEYIWAAAPVRGPEHHHYNEARGVAEKALAARKNTKLWGSVPWKAGLGIPKSSLDGQRESVIHTDLFKEVRSGKLSTQDLWQRYRVRPNEHLCGVGLLKRLGLEFPEDFPFPEGRPPFHSTGHIAAGPLQARLCRIPGAEKRLSDEIHALDREFGLGGWRIARGRKGGAPVAEIRNIFDTASIAWQPVPRVFAPQADGTGFDGSLLFAQRNRDLIDELGIGADSKRIESFYDSVRKILVLKGEPLPYYGILLADGDRMGAALDALSSRGVKAHQAFSEALEGFAESALGIVEKGGGSLVYAGGDDVLALVPLHTALQISHSLSVDFSERVNGCIPADVELEHPPSLSVGLAVAHFMEPMGDSLNLARRAERLAKGPRNALAVVVSKRSGSDIEAVGEWNAARPLHERIVEWAKLLLEEKLPDGVAFHLEELAARFEPVGPAATDPAERWAELKPAVQSLTKRLLNRRRAERGATELSKDVRNCLDAVFDASEEDPARAVLKVSHEIQIARIFATAFDQAWGDIPND